MVDSTSVSKSMRDYSIKTTPLLIEINRKKGFGAHTLLCHKSIAHYCNYDAASLTRGAVCCWCDADARGGCGYKSCTPRARELTVKSDSLLACERQVRTRVSRVRSILIIHIFAAACCVYCVAGT